MSARPASDGPRSGARAPGSDPSPDRARDAGADRRRVGARGLGIAAAIALVGLAGALPGSRGGADPLALLAWLAFAAVPLGALASAAGLRPWPLGAVAPALWVAALAFADAASPRDLATPAWSALALAGLYALGLGLGLAAGRSAHAVAAALALACLAACALPLAPALSARPLAPSLRALLVDLSPATLLAECAGLDWMRHPAIYEGSGTYDIDPSLRAAFRGSLAGPVVFVLGCGAAAAGVAIARARGTRERAPVP